MVMELALGQQTRLSGVNAQRGFMTLPIEFWWPALGRPLHAVSLSRTFKATTSNLGHLLIQ